MFAIVKILLSKVKVLIGLLAIYIFSILTPLLFKLSAKKGGVIISLVPLSVFILFLSYAPAVQNGAEIRDVFNWFPSAGFNFNLYLDGLSLLFSLIISGVGFAVFLYAGSYLEKDKNIAKFYVYIQIFMASMLGVVLSDNMFTMFVFWELTSISSYLLIGYYHGKAESRYSALQALLITGGGGLALLAGLIILSSVSGTYLFSDLHDLRNTLTADPLYPLMVVLILLGAFTKSAQFPFHFWLPNAMAAPSPVSAYLHSATMVKAGIYLLARLNYALNDTVIWNNTIILVGALTMITGAVLSLKQKDLKKLLAYSTVVVLGTLTMLIGIGTNLAIKAFLIYIIAHSLYKGTLFLVAGSIDHEAGTRDITRLSGLGKLMPITALIAVLASLSKMGIIPLIGFVSKETVYSAVIEVPDFGWLLTLLTLLGNIAIVMITVLVGFKPFYGKPSDFPKNPHETPLRMWLGPLLLAGIGLLLGLKPEILIGTLLDRASISVISEELGITVKLWHGFNFVLILSLMTVGFGLLLYFYREKVSTFAESVKFTNILYPSAIYDRSLKFLLFTAKRQTQILQNGNLRAYILVIMIAAVITIGYFLLKYLNAGLFVLTNDFGIYEIIVSIIILGGTIAAVRAKSRLVAVVSLGTVGFGMALLFVIFSAPDLALTQFAIETLTVILFVLVIYRLPKYLNFSNVSTKIRDALIAVLVGTVFAGITLVLSTYGTDSRLKEFFAENSYPLGKGRNIVNVILVDFRALDTLGEITVLAIAAIGVYALIKLRKKED